MKRLPNVLCIKDRASPRNDAQTHRPTSATNILGLPSQGRARPKTLVPESNLKVRFATLNVGTLSGKTKELACLFKRRKVDFVCLQETRWTGSKARNIGEGYKIINTGAKDGRNGVAVAVHQDHLENIVEINRVSDRLMYLKILIEGELVNVISAYAPQTGCSEIDKTAFWNMFDGTLQQVPAKETIIIGGDLNGHIGTTSEPHNRIHGGHGYGTLNEAGKVILQTAMAFDLAIINSFFKKKPEHIITYKSGPASSQIDYILTNRAHIGRVKNCKVIPGECAITQHRIVVADMVFKRTSKLKPARTAEITKWWNLKGEKTEEFRQHLSDVKVDTTQDVDEIWEHLHKCLTKAGNVILGRTKGGKRTPRETWWWTDTVQQALKDKKSAFKTWQATKTPEDREEYKKAKKHAKKTIAIAQANSLKDMYSTLDSKEGQKQIYKLAKQRNQSTKDPATCRVIKGTNGDLLYKDKDIIATWQKYYEDLLNKTPVNINLPEAHKNQGLIAPINP
ncbi:unnamed protein product [Plutella xylostella]|uniref:(diamondback moth) hypothetical protein n=1 Tax=Plutella xylostella TaxID=51655 RepID=A0A8S4G9F6_PLUXY|nr:unnamed protein product [Plutella xylostella]